MKLIVGLGNPGKQYEMTRHNIGFMVISYLSRVYNIKVKKLQGKALTGDGQIAGEKVILAMPQTYMNLSGESVRELCAYYKIAPQDVIVIYDDKDIDVGKIRIRPKGSAGGHNGMKSIIYQLQSDEFPRIRVGIGHPTGDLADYVLGHFSKDEQAEIEKAGKHAAQAVEMIITDSVERAMNSFNGLSCGE